AVGARDEYRLGVAGGDLEEPSERAEVREGFGRLRFPEKAPDAREGPVLGVDVDAAPLVGHATRDAHGRLLCCRLAGTAPGGSRRPGSVPERFYTGPCADVSRGRAAVCLTGKGHPGRGTEAGSTSETARRRSVDPAQEIQSPRIQ